MSYHHEAADTAVDTGDSDEMTVERTPDSRESGKAAPEPDGATPAQRDELPLDVVFGILKNYRRRLVIRYLVEVSETTTLSDLAEHIAAVENDKSEQALTSSERKRVYVCLYQCHLPKMDDAGIIDFEDDRGTVQLADNTEQFTRYLDTDEDDQTIDWPKYYVALSLIGGSLFVAQRLIYPSSVLSGIVMGALLGTFATLAFEHAYERELLRPRMIRRRRRTQAAADTS